MEKFSISRDTFFKDDRIYGAHYNAENISYGKPSFSPVIFSLTVEGGKSIFNYLKNFNLSNDPDIMILPPNHYYYYDKNDFQSVRTLISLKKLNQIKDIDTFLRTLFLILPPNVNFIGCFSDSNTLKDQGFLSGLSNRLVNFIDSRTDRYIDKTNVSELLEKYGFKVVDMTEMNGLTYFYSQNKHRTVEMIA